jgi:hypothetical protein
MDPQVSWQELIDALQELDWERVRDLADGLLHWMKHGGFPPETLAVSQLVVGRLSEPTRSLGHDWNRNVAQAACSYALDLATQVLQDPNGIPRGVPFTLSCSDCDSGHPESYDEAVAAGWTDIRFVPQSMAENFLGLCPECRSVDEATSSTTAG